MNRGLYERDKMLFKLLVTLKIMTVANQILADDSVFFKNGTCIFCYKRGWVGGLQYIDQLNSQNNHLCTQAI